MLILLPPSETKLAGGAGAPLQLDALAHAAELGKVRLRLCTALARLSARPKAAAAALDLGPRQLDELAYNVALFEAPTMPAIERYTGVLYDALDIATLTAAQRARADARLAIGSALFGLARADDRIPAYRLSAGSRLPRIASLAALWKPALTPVLRGAAADELIVDLRSGAYRALAPATGALTVRVLSERADGSRGVVSHFNKATKGRLARMLASGARDCTTVDHVAAVANRAGLLAEQVGDHALDIITREALPTR